MCVLVSVKEMERDDASDEGTPGRRTRGALADLSSVSRQLAGMTVTLLNTPNVHMPSSMMSPAPSPDEMIIRLRGRKKTPITWSPASVDGVQKLSQYQVTPTKDATPTRTVLGLRTSPRKRLQLSDTREMATNTSPDKLKKPQPGSKRPRTEGTPPGSPPLEVSVNALSRWQLVDLIQKLAAQHPELKHEIQLSMPEPDLQPVEEQLMYLKKNIFKSLPNSRLSSKTDSAAFNKACVHLNAFKKCVVENAKLFAESQQWCSLLEYCFMAWPYVKSTPVWDNVQHNVVRRHCFKCLTSGALQALQRGSWDSEALLQIKGKFERLVMDSEHEVETILNHLNSCLADEC